MSPLTREELKSHPDAKVYYISGERFNLKFNVSNEISVVFHNGSNHDYHFIIKELPNKFEGQFECLEDNIEKYKTLSLPIEKEETKMNKYGNDSVVITYILENKIYC